MFWALPAFQRSGTAAGSGNSAPSRAPSGAADQTESDVVVPVVRVVVVAVGNSGVVGVVVPATATDAAVGGSVQSMADARK